MVKAILVLPNPVGSIKVPQPLFFDHRFIAIFCRVVLSIKIKTIGLLLTFLLFYRFLLSNIYN